VIRRFLLPGARPSQCRVRPLAGLFTKARERQWEKKPEDLDEYVEFIKSKSVRYIDWGEVGQVWNASPRDAIEMWRAIRLEARDEFFSGHYGARPFEARESHHEVFRRALRVPGSEQASIDVTLNTLLAALPDALAALERLMGCGNPVVEVKAARSVLSFSQKIEEAPIKGNCGLL
jgi:hypothetical protein